MGNTPPAAEPEVPQDDVDDESVAASVIQKKWKKRASSEFKWPENLYVELKDMAELVNLSIYLDQFFKAINDSETLKELGVDMPAESPDASGTMPASGPRKLTLARLQSLVEEKKDILAKSKAFRSKPEDMLTALQRIGDSMSARKVSIVGLNGRKLADSSLFYYVLRDDKLKRMTVIIPPANYDVAWTTKTRCGKEICALKRALKAKVSGDRIAKVGVHQGFYNYLFAKTGKSKVYSAAQSKYAELFENVSDIMKTHPKHRLYFTGFGVSGAIAQLAAFYMTFEDQVIPKPISCINFGAPRVGDCSFWRACQLLEIAAKLRVGRVTMESGDSVPSYQSGSGFTHTGCQVVLGASQPQTLYPTVEHDGASHFNMFSSKAKKAAKKAPEDYSHALEKNKDGLKALDLNQLYFDAGAKNLMFAESSSRSLTASFSGMDTTTRSDPDATNSEIPKGAEPPANREKKEGKPE